MLPRPLGVQAPYDKLFRQFLELPAAKGDEPGAGIDSALSFNPNPLYQSAKSPRAKPETAGEAQAASERTAFDGLGPDRGRLGAERPSVP